jgi:hypothetical protein
MPHRIERKFGFRPSALNDLARAFDIAWQELRARGVEANNEDQIECIKTKLAQRIMEYATEGEQDVVHVKEFGLQGIARYRLDCTSAVSSTPVATTSMLLGPQYGDVG